MATTTIHNRTGRTASRPRRLVTSIIGLFAAVWRALPRVEPITGPITGPFEDGPGERSVIINGRRVVYSRAVRREPGKAYQGGTSDDQQR